MEETRDTKRKKKKKHQEASLMKSEEANYRKVCANKGEKKKNSSKLQKHAEAEMLIAQKLKVDALFPQRWFLGPGCPRMGGEVVRGEMTDAKFKERQNQKQR